jgi:hypothetical protein
MADRSEDLGVFVEDESGVKDFFTDSKEMSFELNRFSTFVETNLVKNFVKFKKFASAGFHVTEGEIKCYCCSLLLPPTQYNEDVFEYHKKTTPTCPFVTGDSINTPIYESVSFFENESCIFCKIFTGFFFCFRRLRYLPPFHLLKFSQPFLLQTGV